MRSNTTPFEEFLTLHFKGRPLPAGLDTPLKALQLDSLDLFDFILAIEKAFGIELDVDAITDDMSLRDLHTKVQTLKA